MRLLSAFAVPLVLVVSQSSDHGTSAARAPPAPPASLPLLRAGPRNKESLMECENGFFGEKDNVYLKIIRFAGERRPRVRQCLQQAHVQEVLLPALCDGNNADISTEDVVELIESVCPPPPKTEMRKRAEDHVSLTDLISLLDNEKLKKLSKAILTDGPLRKSFLKFFRDTPGGLKRIYKLLSANIPSLEGIVDTVGVEETLTMLRNVDYARVNELLSGNDADQISHLLFIGATIPQLLLFANTGKVQVPSCLVPDANKVRMGKRNPVDVDFSIVEQVDGVIIGMELMKVTLALPTCPETYVDPDSKFSQV